MWYPTNGALSSCIAVVRPIIFKIKKHYMYIFFIINSCICFITSYCTVLIPWNITGCIRYRRKWKFVITLTKRPNEKKWQCSNIHTWKKLLFMRMIIILRTNLFLFYTTKLLFKMWIKKKKKDYSLHRSLNSLPSIA